MTVATKMPLRTFSQLGYATLERVQQEMEAACLKEQSARWVPVPGEWSRGTTTPDFMGSGVHVRVTVETDLVIADLSWMAANAYSYALYTGCMDLLKRRVGREGSTRYVTAGSSEFCEADIGPVHMRVMLGFHQLVDDEGRRI